MKFSIIAAVYNEEKYLHEFLNSIIKQTYQNYEVILVDDGSKDASGNICDLYAQADIEKRVKIIHQENRGVLLAKRKALEFAEGDYVIIVDSDDLLERNLLERLAQAIKKEEADIYFYNANQLKEDGIPKKLDDCPFEGQHIYKGEEKKEIYRELIAKPSQHAMWRKAVKRSVIDIGKDYTELSFVSNGEDLLQTIEIYDRADSICYLEDSLYIYRNVNNGLSKRYNPGCYRSLSYVYSLLEKYLVRWDMEDDKTILYKYFMDIVYDDLSRAANSNRGFGDSKAHMQYILQDTFFNHILQNIPISDMLKSRKAVLFLLRAKAYLVLYLFLRMKE